MTLTHKHLTLILLTSVVTLLAFQKPVKAAVTCFLKGEQTSGMNKICYYDCLGSAAAITIKATQLCPLNIQQ
jgi:hypothetical protein